MRFPVPGVLVIALLWQQTPLKAQTIPERADSGRNLPSRVWLGLLPAPSAVPATQALRCAFPCRGPKKPTRSKGPTAIR
jgi:hypothetical protein